MLVVRIELWPRGDRSQAREIATGMIVNDGKGTTEMGLYDVLLLKRNRGVIRVAHVGDVWKRGRVEGFPRKRLGPWDLLFRALASIVGDRNPNAKRDFEFASRDIDPGTETNDE